MSTTEDRTTTPPTAPTGSGLGPRAWTVIGLAIAAAIIVLVVGLPADATLFGESLDTLTVPAALVIALGAVWAAGWASTERAGWRVVDIVVAAVLGVAGGLLFAVWNLGWEPLSASLSFFPPLSALFVGVWLLPGVLGALVIRRPGAAVFVEVVAAVVSALVGNSWGFSTVWYGFVEGLGAELVVALLLYRSWGLLTGLLAGASAGVVVGFLDTFVYYSTFEPGYKVVYIAFAIVSGVVIAGAGAHVVTRALAATGALAPLASGRSAARV